RFSSLDMLFAYFNASDDLPSRDMCSQQHGDEHNCDQSHTNSQFSTFIRDCSLVLNRHQQNFRSRSIQGFLNVRGTPRRVMGTIIAIRRAMVATENGRRRTT
ncbi:hypothetical protein PMAYCL1PPCAC_21601, partial [Pristionchus mayeri]